MDQCLPYSRKRELWGKAVSRLGTFLGRKIMLQNQEIEYIMMYTRNTEVCTAEADLIVNLKQ